MKGGIIYPGIIESVNPSACNRTPQENSELILGFHQRPSDDIFSPIPLNVFSKVRNEITNKRIKFKILGSSDLYRKQAEKLNIVDYVEF